MALHVQRLVTVLCAAAMVSAPAAAATPAYNPWVSLSAFASPVSAAPLAQRTHCRTDAEETRAREELRAGLLPFCILDDSGAALLPQQSAAFFGAGHIGTMPLLLSLAGVLGLFVLPISMYAADGKDVQPISPA